jgi:DNA polymerase-3 subunit epsilon
MNTLFDQDFFLIDEGKTKGERAVVLIQNGHYQGFGYIDWENVTTEDLFECIKKYPRSADCNKIVRQFMSQNKGLKMVKI